MSILNWRKPKAVAPVLIVPPEPSPDWEAMYRSKEAAYNEVVEQYEMAHGAALELEKMLLGKDKAVEELQAQVTCLTEEKAEANAERDAQYPRIHTLGAENFRLTFESSQLKEQLAMAHEVETSQAEVIATQKSVIENLEKRLEDARVGDTLMAEGYDQLVARQMSDAAAIENWKREAERLASTMANIAEREEALKKEVAGWEKDFKRLVAEEDDAKAQAMALRILSRRAIHLLLFPRGMHQSWKVDREKLLAEYRAIGIEDE